MCEFTITNTTSNQDYLLKIHAKENCQKQSIKCYTQKNIEQHETGLNVT